MTGKSQSHALDALGIIMGPAKFDTALAAYDLNPSQSDYPVSKLAATFLGASVEDGDAAACAEAVFFLREKLRQELDKQGMGDLYDTIELPLLPGTFMRWSAPVWPSTSEQLRQFGSMLSERALPTAKA